MKRIAILGSTGSIGRNTMEVIRGLSGEFRAIGLSTNSNVDILFRQVKEFRPDFVCVGQRAAAAKLKDRLGPKEIKVLSGESGLAQMIRDKRIDKIVLAISSGAALSPLLEAIECGKDIALANKEALVMAGHIIMKRAAAKGVEIIPIDSEQSAIWQCLKNEARDKIRNIYLTASGGPFREKSRRELWDISATDALRHPKWKMGPKISVDSANLMNKGLEVLEAMHLFKVDPGKIKVVIHPQAIIHSMVEFQDGVIMAQLSVTDMRIPIQYALTYPKRLNNSLGGVDFFKIKRFDFQKPDPARFPCLGLAYRAAHKGGTLPAVLNAANEVCVKSFLAGKIKFLSIPGIIAKVLDRHIIKKEPGLNDILAADEWARREAREVIR